MTEDKKTHWLTRRLKELGKNKIQLANVLGIDRARLSELDVRWKFQTEHIKKAADFLEFDRMAFLDFVSGDITEDELWNSKPPLQISEEDLVLLRAVKSIAIRKETEEKTSDNAQSQPIQTAKGQER